MKLIKATLLTVFSFLCLLPFAKSQHIDSLLLKLYQESNDSTRVLLLQNIARAYEVEERNPILAENYLLEAKRLAESSKSNYLKIEVYTSLGVLYRNLSNYTNAIRFHNDALNLAKELDDKHQQVKSLNNLGVVYRRLDNHAYASEYHMKALKLAEEIKDSFNISVACNSLGNIFSLNGRYNEALDYFQRALYMSKQMNNLLGQAMNYNNIGEVYEFKGNYLKAKEYYSKSLDLNYQINSLKGIAINFNALGKIELFLGNTQKAYDYFIKSLEIDKTLGDKKFIADSYINLAKAQLRLNYHKSALDNIHSCLKIATEIKSLTHFQQAYEVLSDYYQKIQEYSKTLEYYKLSASYKDSVLNEKNSRHIATIQTLYETEKKENEIKHLLQQHELKQRAIIRQKNQTYILLLGLLLSGVMLFIIYFALKNKRKTAEQLAKQIEEIELKNMLLEEKNQEIEAKTVEIEKNKDFIVQKNKNLEEAYSIIETYIQKITDSIRYAERIQDSIQPSLSSIKQYFSDTFIFSRPKDIVSGDFYWMLPRGNKVFFALADCTGHGVPGAFMSIIGIGLINQAVNQYMLYKTDDILSFIDEQLVNRLSKSKNETILKDSMDIAMCVFDKETYTLEYTSALIPLFLQRNGEVQELKPNFVTLGTRLQSSQNSKNFTVNSVKLMAGDWLYLSSDGYFDQQGGENHKKFMRSRFKEQLIKMTAEMDSISRYSQLERTFLEWMNRSEQIDDVLIWGIRI